MLSLLWACDASIRIPSKGGQLPQFLPGDGGSDGGTDGGTGADDNRIEDGSSGIGPNSCHCSCTSAVGFDFGWIVVDPGLTPDDVSPSCWVFDASLSREYDVFVNSEPFLTTDPEGATADALRAGRFFVGFRVTSEGPNDECMVRDEVRYNTSEWRRNFWLPGPTNPTQPATYSYELLCRNSGSPSDPGVHEASLYIDVYTRNLQDEPDAGTGIARNRQQQNTVPPQGTGHEP